MERASARPAKRPPTLRRQPPFNW